MRNFYTKSLLTALLLLCGSVASAHDFEVDGIFYNITDATAKTVEVTYSGSSYDAVSDEYSGVVTIPSTVTYNGTTYSVTLIGGSALRDCTGITSITIPNSVTAIGNYVFNGCNSLKNVRIEDGTETLALGCNLYYDRGGKGLFFNCPLKTLYLGRNLSHDTSYKTGFAPFYNKTLLTSVEIGNCVTIIGDNAFYKCDSLKSVTIGNSMESIGDKAFQYCDLREVHIPASVTTIGDYAFTWNRNLQKITMDSGNKVYNIPSGNNIIMKGDSVIFAWRGAVIPENATYISNGAFNSVKEITSVTIPASVTGIGEWAFEACSDLTEIHCLSGAPVTIYSTTFDGLYSSVTLYVPAIGKKKYAISNYWRNFTNIVPVGGIIADSLSYAVISEEEKTVQVIDYSGSNGIVNIPSSITHNGKTYSVTKIGGYAFYDCRSLTSVTIPNSVTSIGENAYYFCSNLKTIYNNSSINLVAGSRDNGYAAYYAHIIFTKEDEQFGDYVFRTTEGTHTLIKYNGNDSIITLPANYKGENYNIGDYAFENCTNLKSITIPNSITSIGDYAFYGCTGLTAVHISDLSAWCKINFSNIYSNPLYYAKNLYLNGEVVADLVIPNNVTEIGNYTFSYYTSLTSVTIPNSVTSIGSSAFNYCTGLTEIYVKATTPPTIDGFTFYKCYDATLYVPAGTKAAYQAADYWKNFTNIVEVIIPGDIDGDSTVDIADVTALVEIILNGKETEEVPTEQTFEDWTSTNGGTHSSTSQNSYTLKATEGSVLTFDWSVSSESNYDYLIITLDGTEILRKSGSYSGSHEYTFTAAGTHTLVAKYTKDGSASSGSDQGKIYNIKLSSGASNKPIAGDVDSDGTVDIADVTSLVNIILFGEKDDTSTGTAGVPQDLGLSVKWANCNVGATAAWEHGGYYAWGETEEKEDYSQSTYKFNGNSSLIPLTKYYNDNTLGLGGDGKTILDPEDDVAQVKWGSPWRMPTKGEIDELREKCTWELETLYGVNGYRVTGPNGNSIFLPAAGYRSGTVSSSQQGFFYWSNSIYVIGGYTDVFVIDETFAEDDYFFEAVVGRIYGLPVRPVCD